MRTPDNGKLEKIPAGYFLKVGNRRFITYTRKLDNHGRTVSWIVKDCFSANKGKYLEDKRINVIHTFEFKTLREAINTYY